MKVDTLASIVKSSQDETEVDDNLLNAFVCSYAYIRFKKSLNESLLNFYDKKNKEDIEHLNSFKDSIDKLLNNKIKEDHKHKIYLEVIRDGIDEFIKS